MGKTALERLFKHYVRPSRTASLNRPGFRGRKVKSLMIQTISEKAKKRMKSNDFRGRPDRDCHE